MAIMTTKTSSSFLRVLRTMLLLSSCFLVTVAATTPAAEISLYQLDPPTAYPTVNPTAHPTAYPTAHPTAYPSADATAPSASPIAANPTSLPIGSAYPTGEPTAEPTGATLGQDSPAQDSPSIALIIVWTLVVFLLALCVISLVKYRCFCCCEKKQHDPFSYKAPSESLFSKMAHRGGGRGGSGSGSNKFGRLGEMELSSGGGSDAGDDATGNPLFSWQQGNGRGYSAY